jgi:hypothetical protein
MEFDTEGIEEVFTKIEERLLANNCVRKIKYDNFEISTFDINQQAMLKEIAGNPIIYCLWSGNNFENLKPKYIGHAGPSISRQRIRAHLTKKNKATGAQLLKVKQELVSKNYIGLSFEIISPGYMRKALEDWLIDKNSTILEWNQIGKRKL